MNFGEGYGRKGEHWYFEGGRGGRPEGPFLILSKLWLLLATMCINENILLAVCWERNWGHSSARAEVWVMSLAQPFFQWKLQLCGSLFEKGRAAEKPAEIVGKQVTPSNPSVCVDVLLCLWRANCIGLLLGVVTLSRMRVTINKTTVLFLIPNCFGNVLVCSYSFPCACSQEPFLYVSCYQCAFFMFWYEKHPLCFNFVLLRN